MVAADDKLPSGVARALRRLREGAVIHARPTTAWIDNSATGLRVKLHRGTFDALIARGLIEEHPTLFWGWRLKSPSTSS